jgi:crotonobetainyl-CoA:carnitine CoA-transferase CaiB-like acyl-CoA transferase
MVVEYDHPVIGRVKSIGLPIKSTGELTQIRHAAPWLGQHSEEALQSLGYSEKEVAALFSEGVVYNRLREKATA